MIAQFSAILLACSVAIAVLPGCGDTPSTEDALAVSAEAMCLVFPPSTRVLGYYHAKDPANRRFEIIPSPDDAIWLKSEMDRKDVEAFLATSPLAGKTLTQTDRGMIGILPGQSWWDADRPGHFRTGRAALPQAGAGYLDILIDMDGGERATVYLMWYTT
jgi:hypothetical protein